MLTAGFEDDAQGAAAGGGSPLEPFVGRLLAGNDFVRALGEYRLHVAEADLAEAKAAGEAEKAMILDAVRSQLIADLGRLDDARKAAAKKASDLASRARYALLLLEGRRVGGSYGRIRDAYKYFETRAMIESGPALFAPISGADEAITGGDFLDNADESRACADPGKADLRNALTLINWSFRMGYLARPGTAVMERFAGLFRAIGSVAEATIESIHRSRDQMRSETYATWDPVRILGLDATDAEKGILESPGPKAGA